MYELHSGFGSNININESLVIMRSSPYGSQVETSETSCIVAGRIMPTLGNVWITTSEDKDGGRGREVTSGVKQAL
jgi:hypothetical protein